MFPVSLRAPTVDFLSPDRHILFLQRAVCAIAGRRLFHSFLRRLPLPALSLASRLVISAPLVGDFPLILCLAGPSLVSPYPVVLGLPSGLARLRSPCRRSARRPRLSPPLDWHCRQIDQPLTLACSPCLSDQDGGDCRCAAGAASCLKQAVRLFTYPAIFIPYDT